MSQDVRLLCLCSLILAQPKSNLAVNFFHLVNFDCSNLYFRYNMSTLGSDKMKIHTTDDSLRMIVDCIDETEKAKAVTLLHSSEAKMQGWKYDRTFMIESYDILYFDTIDKKIFLYTVKEVYEVALRLYEIESTMDDRFIRINKSCIINFDKLISIKADLGGRIMCTLVNQEKVSVSRQYANDFKRKLGGK